MRQATEQELSDARIAALSVEGGFWGFYDLRDFLDKRFPDVTFTLDQEEDIWFSVPDKTARTILEV